ncbi:MAG: hypothetical protein AB8G17_05060 [Gammaproteobacteria bacterium]
MDNSKVHPYLRLSAFSNKLVVLISIILSLDVGLRWLDFPPPLPVTLEVGLSFFWLWIVLHTLIKVLASGVANLIGLGPNRFFELDTGRIQTEQRRIDETRRDEALVRRVEELGQKQARDESHGDA